MKAIHYAWAWLINNGLTGAKFDYYMGEPTRKSNSEATFRRLQAQSKSDISKIGVDWDKTSHPFLESFSEFTDTNSPPATKYGISGAIRLKNGEVQHWIASAPDPMELFSHVADNEHLTTVAKTLFGEI